MSYNQMRSVGEGESFDRMCVWEFALTQAYFVIACRLLTRLSRWER